MKCIWQKYKVWVLIVMLYTLYGMMKVFKTIKRIDFHKSNFKDNRSKLKCG